MAGFFSLPLELRNRIYEIIAQEATLGQDAVLKVSSDKLYKNEFFVSRSALIVLNRQAHAEYYPVLCYRALYDSEYIIAQVKNFDFRQVFDFIDSLSSQEVDQLRRTIFERMVLSLGRQLVEQRAPRLIVQLAVEQRAPRSIVQLGVVRCNRRIGIPLCNRISLYDWLYLLRWAGFSVQWSFRDESINFPTVGMLLYELGLPIDSFPTYDENEPCNSVEDDGLTSKERQSRGLSLRYLARSLRNVNPDAFNGLNRLLGMVLREQQRQRHDLVAPLVAPISCNITPRKRIALFGRYSGR